MQSKYIKINIIFTQFYKSQKWFLASDNFFLLQILSYLHPNDIVNW
jgi:hypothetical protein